MTAIIDGSLSKIFRKKDDIIDHLLLKVLENKKRHIGTEWEVFFIGPNGSAITREDGLRAFVEFKRFFSLSGFNVFYLFEDAPNGYRDIVGISIEDLGVIVPEAGFQFEFSCSVCTNPQDILRKNSVAFSAFCDVAERLGYKPVFKGYVSGYAETAEGIERSRSREWRRYYYDAFGTRASALRETQDGTASVQVTLDSGSNCFHEFFSTLLLIEPLLSIYYSNSIRSYVGISTYGKMIPSQVSPITEAWQAVNPRVTVEKVVDRLLLLNAPFLPDENWPSQYKAERTAGNRAPKVYELMEKGRLNEKTLNNLAGFFYTRPALKDFSTALLELRGIDSQPMPEIVTYIARHVASLVYNDHVRTKLLHDYRFLTKSDISRLHTASTAINKNMALQTKVAGLSVQEYIEDIMRRGETQSAVATSGKLMKGRLRAVA